MKHEIAWFNGRPIAQLILGSVANFTFTDHLGTPILQTDASGAIQWRAEYEPYGDIWTMRLNSDGVTVAAAGDQPLRFPGQEYAGKWEGTEERYNIHRWYRSVGGRYTQVDPVDMPGQEYAYGSENPGRYSDRLGLLNTGQAAKQIAKQFFNACEEEAGGSWAGPIGMAIVALFEAGDANPEEFENQIKKCDKCKKKECPPCTPPVGTIGYRWDKVPPSKPHKPIAGDHLNLYLMNQNAETCECFWNRLKWAVAPPPQPGWVPMPGTEPWTP
jgi:RHS repeat-associated protein